MSYEDWIPLLKLFGQYPQPALVCQRVDVLENDLDFLPIGLRHPLPGLEDRPDGFTFHESVFIRQTLLHYTHIESRHQTLASESLSALAK